MAKEVVVFCDFSEAIRNRGFKQIKKFQPHLSQENSNIISSEKNILGVIGTLSVYDTKIFVSFFIRYIRVINSLRI